MVGKWWRLSNISVYVITEVIVSATANFLFLGFGFVGNSTPTHLVEKGCFFFMCIVQEIAVHATVGEVTADAMDVALDDGVSILIISFIKTVLLGGSFGFIHCWISTLLLMLNFCVVDFSISSSTLDMRSLYSEAMLTGCSCTSHMLKISCYCAANTSISCRIALVASSLSPTEPVV